MKPGLSLLLAIGLTGCLGRSVPVTTRSEPDVDFSSFRTYAQISSPSAQPDVAEAIEEAIRQALDAKGYRTAPVDEADLVVSYRATAEPGVRRVNAGDPDTDFYVTKPSIAKTVAVSFFDGPSREIVWHGVGQADLTRERDAPAAARRVVEAVLAAFPRASG